MAYAWFTPMEPGRVVVFPFDGPEGITPDSRALAYGIGFSVDGAGDLRLFDPQEALVTFSPRRSRTRLNQRSARNTARQVGAGLFVLGSYVDTADRTWLRARLIDTRTRDVLAFHLVEGPRGDRTALARQLARELLLQRELRLGHRPLFDQAHVYQGPMEAFKASLSGERALHRGDFQAAHRFFQEALRLDPKYAAARYGLSVALAWSGEDEGGALEAARAANAATAGGSSSQRDSLLLHALHAAQDGALAEAERALQSILLHDREDVEANYQLGELYFHSNALRATGIDDARNHFAKVLAAEPGDYRTRLHLLLLALRDGDEDAARRELGHALAPGPDPVHTAALQALRESFESPGNTGAVARVLRDAPPASLSLAAQLLTERWRGDPANARVRLQLDKLTGSMVGNDDRRVRLVGQELRAVLAMTRGRWDEAKGELARIDSASATRKMYTGLFASLPFLELPRASLASSRAMVEDWQPPMPPHPSLYEASRPAVREYLLGLLSVRLGDTVAAKAHAHRLTTEHPHEDDGLEWPHAASTLAHDLGRVVRAEVLMARRDTTAALAILDSVHIVPPRLVHGHPVYARGHARYLRGLALRHLGRTNNALDEFRSLAEEEGLNSYMAHAHLQRAQIYDARGDSARADVEYRLFLAYWGDAESQFRQPVVAARMQLQARR
jgi:tetratricopeptide (TPR) repeat protein